ncbi:cell division protein FtsQ/DivIB [Rhizobacter sp. Root404]|jgi:cell division protein FtsQ|uniref:cell division protein FtsQ/DivIB n=1 Tax=Rhizobacter sp. Root404 TaxID=1736528 RepID=UPI0006F50027|nr:cell division protein FtsQ/DivIB [Rhizobacter sp. Root404]KQW38357.1 cell division protein FtsQ [Rhizobacter sp. Root404]
MATLATPTPLPADIRLMNVTAAALATFGVVALVAVAVLWAAHRPVFAVRSIRVDGDLAHNSALTIRANAAPKLAGNFFTMDLAAGRRAFESVPWVRQAVVRRVWPNRLSVQLEEHKPAAFWIGGANADEASDKMVNTHGEVFEANLGDVEDDALPTLRGPDGSSARMLKMIGRLQPEFAAMDARIETLELSGRGSWKVELDTGAEVELGRGSEDEVIARTRSFIATLPEVRNRYAQHPLLYADLRHNDGYAVRLKGISTSVEAAKKK